MSDEICSEAWVIGIHAYSAFVYTLVVIVFSIALYAQSCLRRVFHPFFTLLFVETILCYALCDLFVVILKIMNFFGALEHPAAVFLDKLFHYSYTLIMPLQSCCLVERIVATLYFNSYEKNRRWALLALSQPLSIAFLLLDNYAGKEISDLQLAVFHVAYYVFQTLGLVALLTVNQQLTRKYTGSGVSLTTRYQLAENIRTIRVFLPMITVDTLISLIDIILNYMKFSYVFDPHRCTSDSSYLFVIYIVSEVVVSALELIEAALIVRSYPKVGNILVCWKLMAVHRVSSEGPSRIVNVFGSDLLHEQKNCNHFDDLNKNWEQRQK
ncbi:unnamed protein product [Haemonchus placei]|uniref:G protein-coupled receptor n=1 Tax=Haemonchus placei TaxID=6290 RepID=A0A0N4X856_HAEPC|nr:unnamed protein product [Haemonchus placei]